MDDEPVTLEGLYDDLFYAEGGFDVRSAARVARRLALCASAEEAAWDAIGGRGLAPTDDCTVRQAYALAVVAARERVDVVIPLGDGDRLNVRCACEPGEEMTTIDFGVDE